MHEMENETSILIVDDNPGICETLSDIFEEKGHRVSTANTGQEAVDRIKQTYFNVALIDIRLPDMDGIELLKKFKELHPEMVCMIITGYASLQNAVKALKDGASEYFVKPLVTDEVVQRVEDALNMQRLDREQRLREKTLRETHSELSALYEVSSAISRTLDMDKFLPTILDIITGLEILNVERKGGIFTIEGDTMNLVAHIGHPDAFLNLHKGMKVGDCLCGLAAKTGEIIVSRNSHKDDRHTIKCYDIIPHGYIIVPLKTKDRVVGVLYLYIPADIDIDERKLKLLDSIGGQIGIAIDNARLYEETKILSLKDPLTGLANRRLMNIVLESNFAKAKRYGSPLSAIMLDIDHFKKYNDTYGHTAGDKLLVRIANLIAGETRAMDLVVRYGGEEFLVILPETRLAQARELAERIRRTVEAKAGISISLGVSSYHKGLVTKEDMVNKADEALYQAKQGGRNRIEVSDIPS